MFTRALLLGATLAACAAAQSRVLFFTKVSNPITDGEATAISYSTNDTESPVTITLRKGFASNLETVEVLTDNNYGSEYIWTPPLYLANGNDYALQIEQGEGAARQVNYFGPFTIQGASPSAVRSYSASAASTSQVNATMTTTASTGYSTTMMRNQTMHNATMTAANTSTTSTRLTSTTTTGGSTTGASFQGTQTGGNGGNPSQTGAASSISTTGSSLALALGGIAAILCLG